MKVLLTLFFFSFFSLSQSQSAVFDVARSGSLEDIEKLYRENPEVIDSVNDSGYTPLILAAYRGNQEVASFLAKRCTTIDYISGDGTALMAAAVKGDHFITEKILENKADPNITDTKNTTALHYAVMFGHVGIVELLLEAGAVTSIKDASGSTVHVHASRLQNEAILELLNNTKL
ncbi:ankyrin repeat domain-containing protein [Aquimarina sp. ERC-38]|uniref:ankyrin repeat domain-containing protein n=1 Tax=Aquimarina sp. ERC-38 TaxID=2949996 RepID=UPI002247574C|nr:ankyrin repeat domain-containing protein [Aquimarina sp. ERC-38]UZO80787.1 ankyrin repeat domain-containing protein [Aquimarina sp. ERC-38]